MGDIVPVKRKIFGTNTFKNVVDTNFNQLVPKDSQVDTAVPATVETFFEDYNSLFYSIPPSGSKSSHLELVNRSSEYLNISFEDLKNEIDELRQENVSLKNQIFILANGTIS